MSNKSIVEKILEAPAEDRPRLLRENIEHLKMSDLNRISDSLVNNINGTIEGLDETDAQSTTSKTQPDVWEKEDEEAVTNIFGSGDDTDEDEEDGKVDYYKIATTSAESFKPKAKAKPAPKMVEEHNKPAQRQEPINQETLVEKVTEKVSKPAPEPFILQVDNRVSTDEVTEEPEVKVQESPAPVQPKRPTLVAPARRKSDLLKEAAPLAPAEDEVDQEQADDEKPKKQGFVKNAIMMVLLLASMAGPLVSIYLFDSISGLGLNLSKSAEIAAAIFAGVQVTFSVIMFYNVVAKKMPWIAVLFYIATFTALAASDGVREMAMSLL